MRVSRAKAHSHSSSFGALGGVVVVAALLAIAACASGAGSVPAVPVITTEPGDLSALVGKWSGEYSSGATGRRGSIVFTLGAGRDTAIGDVVMVPAGGSQPLVRAVTTPSGAAAGGVGPGAVITPGSSSALTIRFVRVAGDSVSGTLDPYQSPDCPSCVLTTTFVGRISGDRIDGTFETRGSPTNERQLGRWQVKRTR